MFNALTHLEDYNSKITEITNDTYELLFRVYFYNGIPLKYITELVAWDINTLKTRGLYGK